MDAVDMELLENLQPTSDLHSLAIINNLESILLAGLNAFDVTI